MLLVTKILSCQSYIMSSFLQCISPPSYDLCFKEIINFCNCAAFACISCSHIACACVAVLMEPVVIVAACLYEVESYHDPVKSVTDGPVQWKKRARPQDEPEGVSRLAIASVSECE